MRLPARLALAAVLALTLALAPATAEESEADCYQTQQDDDGNPTGPRFCTEKVWFKPAETKAGNLGATGATSLPTWSTEEPDTSVTGGAGGGYFGNGGLRQGAAQYYDAALGAAFSGTFTGNIDNLDITMYLFTPRQEADFLVGVDLEIDGVRLNALDQASVPITAGGDAVKRIDFALTDVHRLMEEFDLETGDDVEHEITLYLQPYALATTTAIFVYDTTEVPSSMTFNAPDLEGRTKVSIY